MATRKSDYLRSYNALRNNNAELRNREPSNDIFSPYRYGLGTGGSYGNTRHGKQKTEQDVLSQLGRLSRLAHQLTTRDMGGTTSPERAATFENRNIKRFNKAVGIVKRSQYRAQRKAQGMSAG